MTTESNYQSSTYSIISKVAYLAGVEKRHFESEYEAPKMEVFQELDRNKNARIIRNLCMLRTAIEQNYSTLNYQMRWELKNLHSFPELISPDILKQLASDGLTIIKANCKLNQYIININKLIADRINNCKSVFPIWIEWKYLKDLFIMPNGQSETGIYDAAKTYYANQNCYPYQIYINWICNEENGNILYNDKKFVTLLYAAHKDTFMDISKVTDASESVKSDIYRFLDDSNRAVIMVDCENSDPYKLYATLNNLNKQSLLEKIVKIVLCDDINTTSAWDIVKDFTEIPVEHFETKRINSNKSIVDQTLCVKACQEHYKNNADAIIICSSDSNYWGLYGLLDTVNYYVMVETSKMGNAHMNALADAGIPFCFIDDFCTGNSNRIKAEAMLKEVRATLQSAIHLNVKDMLHNAYLATRAEMTKAERDQFYDRYIKSMHLVIGDDGNLAIVTG